MARSLIEDEEFRRRLGAASPMRARIFEIYGIAARFEEIFGSFARPSSNTVARPEVGQVMIG
jgi:hypothetical protein